MEIYPQMRAEPQEWVKNEVRESRLLVPSGRRHTLNGRDLSRNLK